MLYLTVFFISISIVLILIAQYGSDEVLSKDPNYYKVHKRRNAITNLAILFFLMAIVSAGT